MTFIQLTYRAKMEKNIQVLSNTIYPLSAHADTPPDEKDELEAKRDEYVEENERERRKWPGGSTEASRKYEVIGTVLNREVIFSFEVQVSVSRFFSKLTSLSGISLVTARILLRAFFYNTPRSEIINSVSYMDLINVYINYFCIVRSHAITCHA